MKKNGKEIYLQAEARITIRAQEVAEDASSTEEET